MKSRICSLWSPLNRPGTDFMFSQYRLYYTVNNIIERRVILTLSFTNEAEGEIVCWFYLPSPCLGWVVSEIILHSQKIMLKPFAPPPPSSFGVLPACTVSLSDPLSAVFISLSHKESMWKRRQNSDWCDLEGPLSWGGYGCLLQLQRQEWGRVGKAGWLQGKVCFDN